jgi:hypothetical protein
VSFFVSSRTMSHPNARAAASSLNSATRSNDSRPPARTAKKYRGKNDIDETVLPGLTHETLKELGVASIGHRVKLLDAIAALRDEGTGKAPTGDAATTLTSRNSSVA